MTHQLNSPTDIARYFERMDLSRSEIMRMLNLIWEKKDSILNEELRDCKSRFIKAVNREMEKFFLNQEDVEMDSINKILSDLGSDFTLTAKFCNEERAKLQKIKGELEKKGNENMVDQPILLKFCELSLEINKLEESYRQVYYDAVDIKDFEVSKKVKEDAHQKIWKIKNWQKKISQINNEMSVFLKDIVASDVQDECSASGVLASTDKEATIEYDHLTELKVPSKQEPKVESEIFVSTETLTLNSHEKLIESDKKNKQKDMEDGRVVEDCQIKTNPTYAEYIKHKMRQLCDAGCVFSDKEIRNMLSDKWSKNALHLNRSFMRIFNFEFPVSTQIKDDSGIIRYWAEPFKFGEVTVLINNDWCEESKLYFNEWYNTKNRDVSTSISLGIDDKNSVNIGIESRFECLYQEEKRIQFQLMVPKKRYICLEEAYEWMKVTNEKYTEYRQMYCEFSNSNSVRKACETYPLLTSLILIYTAVYRYNEDDSRGGLWPEFFCDPDYSYQRDVPPVMDAFKRVMSKFKVESLNRNYLEKINMGKIFSQIYIPDVSIRKIYSAIYSYYFKGFRNNCVFNLNEFIESYQYKLDKPGIFFLTEDKLIGEAFEKMIDLFVNHLEDQTYIAENNDLPNRFIYTFLAWLDKEKSDIDNKKEEYNLESPKLYFDMQNEKIVLKLPVQRSKIYSDEEWGWKIKIDNDGQKFIDAQIIKQKEGHYLALNEELDIKAFNSLQISYVYKDQVQRTWNIHNDNDFMIFDEHGRFYTSNRLHRTRCIIGGIKTTVENKDYIIDKYAIKDWDEYIFNYVDLADCSDSNVRINKNKQSIRIEIDDWPSMKRSGLKLAFGKKETEISDNDMIQVYDSIGQYNFFVPNLKVSNFDVVLRNAKDAYNVNCNELLKIQSKSINRATVEFCEERMPKGRYYLTIRYKNKIFHREEFVFIDQIKILDEYNMEYGLSKNLHRKITITKNPHFQIVPTHINTLVLSTENHYTLELQNEALAQFGLQIEGDTVIPIEKVVLPIKWSLIGLENILNTKVTNRMVEITRTAFDNNDIRIQIENFDYRHDVLNYKIIIEDLSNEEVIEISKRIVYGDQLDLSFGGLKDRLIKSFNMSVKLQVLNTADQVLFEHLLFGVVGKIEMLDSQKSIEGDHIYLCWKEKQENKSRILRFYNYLAPWQKPESFKLEDGATEIKLDLTNYEKGYYLPMVDYKKEKSLFEQVIVNTRFFDKEEISFKIINKVGYPPLKQNAILSKIMERYLKGRLTEVDQIIIENSGNKFDAKKVFLTMIQMFYFTDNKNNEQMDLFLCQTFKMMRVFLNPFDVDGYLKLLIESKDEITIENFKLLQTIILASVEERYYSDRTIDILAGYDAIDALCGIKNGSGVLTDNLRTNMVETFDLEVLQSARNGERILEMVENEIQIISEFWNWLYYSHENNYILKNNYTLDRAFRIYEYENGITTHRINGNNIDDLIESIRCKESYNCTIFPQNWDENLGVEKDVFYQFKNLLKMDMDPSYMELLKCAFLSVLPNSIISDMDYYSMMVSMQLTKQIDLFQRYRAYFKLIFI